ncbi:MAG: alpha/beta hydrolase-fold protein, partial [Jatrophihabitans sp.]
MRREHLQLAGADLIAYGHYGRPVLAFPAEAGRAWDFENNGMIDAVADLVDAGRMKLYCVDSADAWTWSDRSVAIEERARRHEQYEQWILQQVLPWVSRDCGGAAELLAVGVSLGAFHAANVALKHADVFPLAICLSGNYDPTSWHAWGEQGDAVYFNNPLAYVDNLGGDHL